MDSRQIGTFVCYLFFFLIGGVSTGYAQQGWRWVDVFKEGSISGRIDHDATVNYQRMPETMKHEVREPVWRLSTHSAGLYVNFRTDARTIQVRYRVEHALQMPHMPATGVSGVDLYAHDATVDEWFWASGSYSFKDTVTYLFHDLDFGSGKDYQLYLPLYNTVTWMEIGVPDSVSIDFIQETEPPIIVYGTSIAQGACASRSGMAWTNILRRAVGVPVVNFGFSGNGRLEEPLLDFIGDSPARAIVLDCLPNIGISPERTEQQLDSLIYHAVLSVRTKQPMTPIILSEHSSGMDEHILNAGNNRRYQQSTEVLRRTFQRLKQKGIQGIYLLTNEDIGFDVDSTVDYAHPNDIGMQKIAQAYQRLLLDKVL